MTNHSSSRWRVDRPIFLIGAPRSGTTIVYEALAVHPELGWISNYSSRFPWLGGAAGLFSRLYDLPLLSKRRGEKRQRTQGRGVLNRYLPTPVEAYDFWQRLCGARFARHYLVDEKASPSRSEQTRRQIASLLRYHGRQRFVAKLTGPPRTGFLRSIFPDAIFVDMVRDGRAVAASLLRVDFWKRGGGYEEPWWQGGLCDGWEDEWQRHGRSPLALAAIQWRRILEVTATESAALPGAQWHRLRYEDFVADPRSAMDGVLAACKLAPSDEVERWVGAQGKYRNHNASSLASFDKDEHAMLDAILGGTLRDLGYD